MKMKLIACPLKYTTRNPQTGTLTNFEDPDVMPHNAAFQRGLHCSLRPNQSLEKDIYNDFGSYNL